MAICAARVAERNCEKYRSGFCRFPDPPNLTFFFGAGGGGESKEPPKKNKDFPVCRTPEILGKESNKAENNKDNRKMKKSKENEKSKDWRVRVAVAGDVL